MIRRLLPVLAALCLAALPAAAETAWKKLVTPAELAEMMAGEAPVVLDIRDPKAYLTANIPGSISAAYPLWRGPRENPGEPISDATLTEVMQGAGLTPESRVVIAYAGTDASDFGAAARVYWTLKSAGLSEIAILNGGVRSWIAAGRPLSVDPTEATPSQARFALSREWMADRAEIGAVVQGIRGATLVDARPAEFHSGKKKHAAAERAGTLPGARSLPQTGWFDGAKTEMPPAERVAELARASGIAAAEGEVVSFCNTGHWAATGWFAMSELAGMEDVKLYPESMVGWTRAGGPVAEGASE